MRPAATRRIVAGLMAAAMLSAGASVAGARIHRLILPPPTSLPTALAVDEREWSVTPSAKVLAAGDVRLSVYNRGMDDHDLAIVDSAGQLQKIDLGPGASGTITANLQPGRHKIWCTLFAGTPAAHETLGMVATIEVRPQIAPLSFQRDLRRMLAKQRDRRANVVRRAPAGK